MSEEYSMRNIDPIAKSAFDVDLDELPALLRSMGLPEDQIEKEMRYARTREEVTQRIFDKADAIEAEIARTLDQIKTPVARRLARNM